jgi:hypothetical protein
LSKILRELADRIVEELHEIEQVVDRSQQSWQQFQQSDDNLYIDSAASNLHGFYNGLERLFEMIATMIDRSHPQGVRWHQELLEQMAIEIEEIRPAVISQNSQAALDEYRRFRHTVRHLYTQQFDEERIHPLIEMIPDIFSQTRSELLAFAAFLSDQNLF